MNELILSKLADLAAQYKHDPKLKFKVSALYKAMTNIKYYDKNITSGADARKNIENIGEGIARRIDEIINTGTLAELGNGKQEETSQNELKMITGVGESRIKTLNNMGINTLEEYKQAIAEKRVKSTHHIDVGIKYYEDFQKRIPRKEIEKMEKILVPILHKINPKLIFNICGSYRREKETCGDVDILITNPNMEDKNNYLSLYITSLKKEGFLIDNLTEKGGKKYMGVCQLKGGNVGRRIDIRMVDYEAYYAALIYFTGSKEFNIMVRKKALKLGYSLSEYGLKKKGENNLIIIHSEKELFEMMELDYVKPKDR